MATPLPPSPLPPVRRIVFSRKGFDTAAGGCPSPLVEGRPLSLPIPAGRYPGGRPYHDLAGERATLAATLGRVGDGLCHLDPDIDPTALAERPADWRGAFGQVGAAQGHLRNQGVGPGDLFLFFGQFRAVERGADGWRWTGTAHHALFGWLRIGEVLAGETLTPAAVAERPWLAGHPHACTGWPASNAIYCAADSLDLPGAADLPGSGVFARGARLTAPDARCSLWTVPSWLEAARMSYRRHDRFWPAPGRMNAHGQWQEAVAPANDEGLAWVGALIRDHAA